MGNGGGPGSDGMAGALLLLGSIAGLVALGLVFALICMAATRKGD